MLKSVYGPIVNNQRGHMQFKELSLSELKDKWTSAWGKAPPPRMGRTMMEKSLMFKRQYSLPKDIQNRLDTLVKQYRRNPNCLEERQNDLKPGTRLVRRWKGKEHVVMVKTEGFEYNGQNYTSLSKIANDITGSRWNGWVFFGLRK